MRRLLIRFVACFDSARFGPVRLTSPKFRKDGRREENPILRGKGSPASDPRRGRARETVIITRHGRPIARIVPEVDNRAAEIRKTMDRIAAFRQTMPRLSVEEILSARHEGTTTDAFRHRRVDRRKLAAFRRGHDIAAAAFERLVEDHALAPGLWWFEMRNLFIVNERRWRMDGEKTTRALALLSNCRSGSTTLPTARPCCALRDAIA